MAKKQEPRIAGFMSFEINVPPDLNSLNKLIIRSLKKWPGEGLSVVDVDSGSDMNLWAIGPRGLTSKTALKAWESYCEGYVCEGDI